MATVRAKDGSEATALHPVLAQQFLWRGRRVFLAFDADIVSNPNVRQALIRTLVLFHKAGAKLCAEAAPLSEIHKPLDLEVIEMEFPRAKLQGARLKQLCRMVGKNLLVDAITLYNDIAAEQQDAQHDLETATPEPWPDPVDGALLADELVSGSGGTSL